MLFTPVIRRAPAHSSLSAHAAVDPSFERFFRGASFSATVEQDETTHTLTIDVPGVAREHISIGIEGAVVRIESLADAPRKVKCAFELPQDIDTTTSFAKLENGVLTLKLAKLAPVSKVTPLTVN